MFDHEPERFRESKDRVGRFAPGIREVLDREKRAVNVVVAVDQKQLHGGKVTKEDARCEIRDARSSRIRYPASRIDLASRISYPVSRMPDEWFVRVQGKEYGPVSTETLREWKDEGRLIRENELRRADEERWIAAGEFPEIFGEAETPPSPPEPTARAKTWREIIGDTVRIYRGGFARFMFYGLLSAVPLFALQWTLPKIPFPDFSSEAQVAIPAPALPPISVIMLLLFLAMLPVSTAGMQLVADD